GADAQRNDVGGGEGRYRVVLTVKNGSGSAYVDGQLVGSLVGKPPSTELFPPHLPPREQTPREKPPERVSHIFFGAYGGGEENAEFHVTLTNVFLYSRLLKDAELKALVTEKPSAPAEEAPTSATAQGGPGNASVAGQGGKDKRDSSVRGHLSAVSLLPLLLGLWACVSLL
ncbi:trans-sialidase, partial [Trypanosoma conorhini]